MDIKQIRRKSEMEELQISILGSYATLKPREGSRKYEDTNDKNDNRTSFQRDRDRIIHTKAFRRLMYKTQVFVNHEGDHFRTRLTHTLEVAQFARGICRSLGLNEDLAEAIALGHDLGHTPFGHAVEEYLDEELSQRELGEFFHNEQSVRIVDFIEERGADNYKGLNLTFEVREGILKHNDDYSKKYPIYAELNPGKPCSTLEGQIVARVDTLAYICHDLEDAIASGLVHHLMKKSRTAEIAFKQLAERLESELKVKIQYDGANTFFTRSIIHEFILKLTENTYLNIEENRIKTQEDIIGIGKTLANFSKNDEALFKYVKKIIYKYIYGCQTITIMDSKAKKVAKDLFEAFTENPKLLPPEQFEHYINVENDLTYSGSKNNEIRVICDYISCMTDRYALDEHEKLFNPRIRI